MVHGICGWQLRPLCFLRMRICSGARFSKWDVTEKTEFKMSTRRKRYSRQAKSKQESDGSSESDSLSQGTDHQHTMRIITRLSQKYLKTRITPGETSQESVTTDTETEQEYYGDEENSPDTGISDVCMTSPRPYDAFDFSSDEDFKLHLILSPVKFSNAKQTKSKPKKKTGSTSQRKSEKLSIKSSSKALPHVSCTRVDLMAKSRTAIRPATSQKSATVTKSISVQETPCQRQLRKRKSTATSDSASTTSVDTTWGVYRCSPRLKSNQSKVNVTDSKRDSGVFISPPVQKRAKLGNGHATSTPSTESRTQKMIMDDSQHGFETIESPVIDISPVPIKQAITPLSDYCSMSSTLFNSMDTSSVEKPTSQGFPFVLQEEEEPRAGKTVCKPKRRKPKEVSETALKWAEKMNKEFEELENFELSIEG